MKPNKPKPRKNASRRTIVEIGDGRFGASYRKITEALFGKHELTMVGIDARVLNTAEKNLGFRLPAALKQYYLTLGAFQKLNQAHNRIVSPVDFEISGGVLPFYEEHQDVCYWGIKPSEAKEDDDPMVYQGVFNETWTWTSYEMRTAAFLRLCIYHQAAWGALEYGFVHPNAKEAIKAIEPDWEKVVDDQGLRIWRNQNVLAWHLGNDTVCAFVTNDPAALKRWADRFGIDASYYLT